MEKVTMTYPPVPGSTAVMTRRQFEEVWKPRGWVEVGAALVEEPASDEEE